MDISYINSQSLLRLLSLTERKEELLQLVEELDAEIKRTLQGGVVSVEVIKVAAPSAPALSKPVSAAQVPAKPAKGPKVKAVRSGGLKDRILALLEAAGDKGIRVKDIAAKLGSKAANISVWFSTTGKDITTKLAPGLYARKGAPKLSVADKPAAKKLPKAGKAKKKSGISPEGRARIAAAAKARWAKLRAGKAAPVAPAAKPAKAKKKGGISPEGRAKLAANMKARWAARRADKAAKPSKKGFKLPKAK